MHIKIEMSSAKRFLWK